MALPLSGMNLPVLMDILALAASTVLIVVLIANRRRYGRWVLGPSPGSNFGSEMKLQMLTQQSQRSYTNIQRALRREFARLQSLTGDAATVTPAHLPRRERQDAVVSPRFAGHYEEARRLMHNGVDPQTIAERCDLSRGEVDLMIYMQPKRS